MKKIKIAPIRLSIQIIAAILTGIGFFANFQITMLIIMIATLLAGSFYCGWVCPFGTLQDLFSKLGKSLGIRKRKMPKAIHRYLQLSRYILFGLTLLLGTSFAIVLRTSDPRVNFVGLVAGSSISVLAMVIVALFAVIALFFERPFCNYLCAEGARYGLFSLPRPMTIKRNTDTCVNCKKCDSVCPMQIEVSQVDQVASPQCINCFACTDACPKANTLTYGLVRPSQSIAKRYGLLAIGAVVVVSGFLLYNVITGQDSLEEGQSTTTPVVAESLATTESTSVLTSDVASDMTTTTPTSSDESQVLVEFTDDLTPEVTETLTEAVIANLGDAAGMADGIYSGVGVGYRGDILVDVTIASQMITKIEVTSYRDDDKWFNRVIDAIPETIINSQSTDVDVVSGATFSSRGIIEAVSDALNTGKGY